MEPTRLLCPWDTPGKNTGVGCHFLLQGIYLPDPGTEPTSPALQADSLPFELPGDVYPHPNHYEEPGALQQTGLAKRDFF